MAKTFLTGIDLVQNQLIRARIENVGALPDPGTAVAGQIVFHTGTTPGIFYYFDGTKWEPMRTTGPAGGDLVGNYPNPLIGDQKVTTGKIADGAVTGGPTGKVAADTLTHDNVNPANRDGLADIPSLRTLGTGAQQAVRGNDPRLSDTRTPTDGSVLDVHVGNGAAIQRNKIADPVNDVSNGGYRLTNLAPGEVDTDAATVAQVNAARQGLDAKDSVAAASTTNLAVTATATTLTATTNGLLTLDGQTPSAGSRVLIKNQTDATQNGIYEVTDTGSGSTTFVLTRTDDATNTGELSTGSQTLVEAGTANGQQVWAINIMGAETWTAGDTSTGWTQIAGVSEVTAGNGLTRRPGNVIDVAPGLGLIADADVLRINTAVVARLVTGTLVGGSNSEVVTHNLGTRHVLVQLFNGASPYDQIEADIERTSATTITIRTGTPIPAGTGYVIHG